MTQLSSVVNHFNFTAIPQSPDPVDVPSLHAASPPRASLSPHISPSAPSISSPGSPRSPVRNNPIHSGRVWQQFQEHALTFKEKTDVKCYRKLCSETMNYCQRILQTQFPNINGFQYTSKVPVYKNINIDLSRGLKKPHYAVRLTKEVKADLQV